MQTSKSRMAGVQGNCRCSMLGSIHCGEPRQATSSDRHIVVAAKCCDASTTPLLIYPSRRGAHLLLPFGGTAKRITSRRQLADRSPSVERAIKCAFWWRCQTYNSSPTGRRVNAECRTSDQITVADCSAIAHVRRTSWLYIR